MSSPLSMAPRTPLFAGGEAHDQPPGDAEQPPAEDVALREGGGSGLGGDDATPSVLVRLDEQLDLRLLPVFVLLGSGLGQRLPRGVLAGETHHQHVEDGILSSGPGGCRPGRGGRALHRLSGAAVDLRGQVRCDCPRRSPSWARREATDDRIRRGSAARTKATSADESGRQPAADALELVLGQPGARSSSAYSPPQMPPSTAQTARLFSPPASRPKRPQVSTGVRAPARVRRGSWTCALCLALTLTTTSSRIASPPCVDPLVQLPVDLRGPLRPGKASQQNALLLRAGAVAPGASAARPSAGPPFIRLWRSMPWLGSGSSSCSLDERGDELDDRPDLQVRLRACTRRASAACTGRASPA